MLTLRVHKFVCIKFVFTDIYLYLCRRNSIKTVAKVERKIGKRKIELKK
jgi:hypothetical protein